MPFEFVDNNAAIGRSARKRIRRHVAMGRNAGKKLLRPSRMKAPGLKVGAVIELASISRHEENDHEVQSGQEIVPGFERQVGDTLSVLSFPEQLTPASRSLVQRGMYASFDT